MRHSRYVTSDIGTVVLLHADGKGYEVEFVTLGGEIIAVTRVLTTQVHPILHKKERIRG